MSCSAALSVCCYIDVTAASSRRRGRRQFIAPHAALVESKPRPVPALRGGSGGDANASAATLSSASVPSFYRDRTDDMQAEVAAMARAANASVYSPELVIRKYGTRPIKVARRALEIFTRLGSFAFNLWMDKVNGQLEQRQRERAIHLRKTFTRLGPTFVKIGQGLSTRPDLCPPQYLEELSQLQDALPTFSDAEAFSCIERELGYPLDSIFSSISASPIAAASLGQVYKAQLKYSGQVVAVKVQRPGIEESIGLDFYLIRALGLLINKYVDIVTSDELNYVQEGQNARRFSIVDGLGAVLYQFPFNETPPAEPLKLHQLSNSLLQLRRHHEPVCLPHRRQRHLHFSGAHDYITKPLSLVLSRNPSDRSSSKSHRRYFMGSPTEGSSVSRKFFKFIGFDSQRTFICEMDWQGLKLAEQLMQLLLVSFALVHQFQESSLRL